MNPSPESRARYFEVCLPLYSTTGGGGRPEWLQRVIVRNEVAIHFNGPHNEQGRFDFRSHLARVKCPTLVMAGDRDPIMPMPFSDILAASLPPALVRFERFANCGHGVVGDAPDRALSCIRDFIVG